MLKGNVIIIHLILGLIKKILYKMTQYFPKAFSRDINVNIDLSDYVTKTDLKNIDLGYFKGKSHFDEVGTQNYLAFQSMLECFTVSINKWITEWKSNGLSNESLEIIYKYINTLSPSISYYGHIARLKFLGGILQEKTVTYNHKKVVNPYILNEITKFQYNNNPILTNALFGAIKLTKNADIKKHKYSGYGTGFDSQITII